MFDIFKFQTLFNCIEYWDTLKETHFEVWPCGGLFSFLSEVSQLHISYYSEFRTAVWDLTSADLLTVLRQVSVSTAAVVVDRLGVDRVAELGLVPDTHDTQKLLLVCRLKHAQAELSCCCVFLPPVTPFREWKREGERKLKVNLKIRNNLYNNSTNREY